jgi:hypothetical protein
MNREELIKAIREILPKLSQAKVDALADLYPDESAVWAERAGGHLVVEEVSYPYLTVGLDAVGNAVTVLFDEDGKWVVDPDGY